MIEVDVNFVRNALNDHESNLTVMLDKVTVLALKELLEYRETGLTPEEVKAMKDSKSDQVDYSLLEYYKTLGTPKECREAREKQKPHKVKFEPWMDTKCVCGYEFSRDLGDGYHDIPIERKTKYCPDCGQKLQWDDKE